MKKLGLTFVFALAVIGCAKKDGATTAAPTSGGAATTGPATGSATGGSDTAMAGSAMAGSAAAGSAAAGSAAAGLDTATTGGGAAGGGSAVAMAGSGAGSAAWDFDKLTHDEQMEFMKKQVVPTMKPLFQKFDAKHYADFGCKTCHGKDPKASKFKMPTPDLPKLDFAALKAGKQKPEIAKWMGTVVLPEMAKLLQRPEYNPEHPDPTQFGCLECHEQKK